MIGTLGVSAGVHRLWSHKCYKARLPLRMLLTFFNTIAFQVSGDSLRAPRRDPTPAILLPEGWRPAAGGIVTRYDGTGH